MRHYGASNLTPLNSNSLQQVRPKGGDWSSLIDDDHAYVMDNGTLRIYNWVIDSVRAEDLPHVVIPDGNLTGTGRWEEQHFMGAGETVKEIWTLDDFNPSAGIITLEAGNYQIKDTINIGTNRFVFASGDPAVLFDFDDSFNNWIEHTGNNMTLISGSGALRLLHGKGGSTFFMSGNNVTFVDITGSFGAQYAYVEWTGTGGIIGSVNSRRESLATAGLLWKESLFIGWDQGVVITNGDEVSMRDVFADAVPTSTGTFLTVKGISGRILLAKECALSLPVGASFIKIDPVIHSVTSISDVYIRDGGTFFEPETKNGTFTAVADASVGATTITGVADSSGIARFAFAVGPTLYVNQRVEVSGFITNTGYNGSWIITATGTGYFEAGIAFGSNESGSFLSDSVTLTETGTTVADGDTVLIKTDSDTHYDIGSYVYNKQTNSFQINAEYIDDHTGTWRDGSQIESSKYVTVRDCGDQRDSYSLAAVHVNGNVDTISATSNTWVDLDLGTAIDSISAARFKLINTATGEIEYTGLNSIDGIINASISAFKSSSVAILHQFRALKTVGTAFETVIAERALSDSLGNIGFVSPANFEPGDRFKLQIRAVGTTTTVTIQNIIITFIPA